jgi:GrpB-like predicted nucleotidyltransferase (UPF0157 family)
MTFSEIFALAPDLDAARLTAQVAFDAVRRELSRILPTSTEVLHVGATAIPGCLTKGDLDIFVRVDPADFTYVDAVLAERFRRNTGSVRTHEFSAFEDPGRPIDVGIQLAIRGGSYDFFQRFAEALRANPQLVQRYNDLKLAFHGKPMADYRAAKDVFVRETLSAYGQGV